MIKLIIFDLDGTLLNTINDLGNSCNYIIKKYGFPTHPLQAYRFFVGNGVGKLIERALPESQRSPEFVEKLRKEFIEYYSKHSEDETVPYPGIIEMLKELEAKKIKLAVASNKFIAGTQSLVQKYFGNIDFVSVLGQREGISVKPDPQIVYDVMKEAGVDNKQEILYVGDSGADMQTSVNSGIEGIGVLWGFRSKEELVENGAVHIVDNPAEIVRLALQK